MSECRLRARAPRSREIGRCCFSSRTGRRCVPGMGSTVGARWTAPADADIPAHLPGPSTHPFPVLGKAVESAPLRKDRCNFRFIPDRLGRRSMTRHRQPPSPPAAASWGAGRYRWIRWAPARPGSVARAIRNGNTRLPSRHPPTRVHPVSVSVNPLECSIGLLHERFFHGTTFRTAKGTIFLPRRRGSMPGDGKLS